MRFVKLFASDESGATAIEYALIASLIAIALIAILGSLGSKLSGVFSEVSSALK
jgi:pilus assembly protein Flp/PilA